LQQIEKSPRREGERLTATRVLVRGPVHAWLGRRQVGGCFNAARAAAQLAYIGGAVDGAGSTPVAKSKVVAAGAHVNGFLANQLTVQVEDGRSRRAP
jgi:hypothetical protein